MAKWEDWPTGTLVAYNHGYLITKKTTTLAAPTLTGAIGAAIGYVGWIEIIATLLIGIRSQKYFLFIYSTLYTY